VCGFDPVVPILTFPFFQILARLWEIEIYTKIRKGCLSVLITLQVLATSEAAPTKSRAFVSRQWHDFIFLLLRQWRENSSDVHMIGYLIVD
jgi:hypothetical protein